VKGNKNRTDNRAMPPAGIGPDMGLTILVNLSSDDYFYPLKNFLGATALIFDPQEFADSGTGGVREVPIEPYQEVRITLNINTKIAVDEVQRYSIEKRGCMFPNDLPEEYNGEYVYGDCMVKCKLKSVIALCKCKPFNMPNDFSDILVNEYPYCSLADIPCINKYRIKWLTYRPREKIVGLEREIEDSLNCQQCYPLCSSSSYVVDSTSTQLNFFYENRGSVMYVLRYVRKINKPITCV
jgi:acid-sensing ion channel, other